jgi:aspartokinase
MSKAGTPKVSFERGRGVYALQVLHDLAHVVIGFGDDPLRTSRIQQALRTLAEADVPVFLVKLHRTAVTLAFAEIDRQRAETVLAATDLKTTVRRDLALVTVRAATMRELHGVMVEIADALYEAGARVYETGDSHNSVQCLIDGARVPEAIKTLCAKFQIEPKTVQHSRMDAEDGR